jgi:hypothetical protein
MIKHSKRYLFLFAIVIVSLLLLKKNLTTLSSPFRIEINSKVENLAIPEIKLIISKELIGKFNSIYTHYSEDFNSFKYQKFVEIIKQRNNWEDAELEFEGKRYKVKIKLHGKTPTQHVERDFYSLGIKLNNGDKIKSVSRFNLIVYWRIRHKYDTIKYLAESNDILFQKDELMKVYINDKEAKLYYFEYRTDDEFFNESNKGNYFILKKKKNNNLIYSEGNISSLNIKVKKMLSKQIKKDSLIQIVYLQYESLNNALYNNDVKKVLSHFEINYLAKIQAFRYIYSDNGHGFLSNNLLLALNLEDLKFYPVLHRDHSDKTLDDKTLSGSFNGQDLGLDSHFLSLLEKSEQLEKRTKEGVINYLSINENLESNLDSIFYFHQNLYYSSYMKTILGLEGKVSASLNVKMLKEKLNLD